MTDPNISDVSLVEVSETIDLLTDSDTDEEFVYMGDENYDEKSITYVITDDLTTIRQTIFIGNIPLQLRKKKKHIKELFDKYGEVQSIRIKFPPVADADYFKKVVIIKQNYYPLQDTTYGFVVFKNVKSVHNVFNSYGFCVCGHKLDVSKIGRPAKFYNKKIVFVQNFPDNYLHINDENLWLLFKSCGELDFVHIIRDRLSSFGNGEAYIQFKTEEAVVEALKIKNTVIEDKIFSVSRLQDLASIKTHENIRDKAGQKKAQQIKFDQGLSSKNETISNQLVDDKLTLKGLLSNKAGIIEKTPPSKSLPNASKSIQVDTEILREPSKHVTQSSTSLISVKSEFPNAVVKKPLSAIESDNSSAPIQKKQKKIEEFILMPTPLEEVKYDPEKGIILRDLPKHINNEMLRSHFQVYGPIQSVHKGGNNLVYINYMTKEAAAFALKCNIQIEGHSVNIACAVEPDIGIKDIVDTYSSDSTPKEPNYYKSNCKSLRNSFVNGKSASKGSALTLPMTSGCKWRPHDERKAVIVQNLPDDIENEHLQETFQYCGLIDYVFIARDKITGRPLGFGYVNFKHEASVQQALQMRNVFIRDKMIRTFPVSKKVVPCRSTRWSNPNPQQATTNDTAQKRKNKSNYKYQYPINKRTVFTDGF